MSQMLLVNPRKRRATKKRRTVRSKRKVTSRRKRRAAPVARRRRTRSVARVVRRRKRNPIGGVSFRGVQNQVMDAGVGAAGAIALDIALGYLPIPANFKTGMTAPLIKGAVAIGLGMALSKVVKSSTAQKMTAGALTVMLHDVMRTAVVQYAPAVKLGGFDDGYFDDSLNLNGYYGSGYNPDAMGEYLPDISSSSMGEYLNAYDTDDSY